MVGAEGGSATLEAEGMHIEAIVFIGAIDKIDVFMVVR